MTRRNKRDRERLKGFVNEKPELPKLDLCNRDDFDKFVKIVGKRTAKAIRFGIAYGVPYNGPRGGTTLRPGAYTHLTSAEFTQLWVAFGTKPR